MPRPILAVFLGDLHVGSNSGLCLPGYRMGDGDNSRPYAASKTQEKLYKAFVKTRETVKAMAKNHRLFVMLGGDLVDGVQHHGTTETDGTHRDQRDMAEELLSSWVTAADDVWGVTGTSSHVGQEGEEDYSIYGRLCKPGHYAPVHNIVLDGRRLWWAHHGVGVGAREWTRSNPMYAIANDVYWKCLRKNIPAPDLIVAHHRHQSPRPVTTNGITVAVCPCWQTSTYYGSSIKPFDETDLGVMVWVPSRKELNLVPANIEN